MVDRTGVSGNSAAMGKVFKPPPPFVKVYGSRLLSSSLLLESSTVFKLFFCMLAKADEDGFVDLANTVTLARMASITVQECEQALAVLESPDPISYTKDLDGRRVIRHEDGGWTVVNAQKYRETRTIAQIRNAERQARHKQRVRAARAAAEAQEQPPDDAYESGE